MNYFRQCTNNQMTQTIPDHSGNTCLFSAEEGFNLGNLFKNLYTPYGQMTNFALQPCSPRQACLMQVQILEFAAHELNLYLDTHQDDEKMLALFNEYNACALKARKEFEVKFGPLAVSDVNADCTSWIWIQGPWPWERQ